MGNCLDRNLSDEADDDMIENNDINEQEQNMYNSSNSSRNRSDSRHSRRSSRFRTRSGNHYTRISESSPSQSTSSLNQRFSGGRDNGNNGNGNHHHHHHHHHRHHHHHHSNSQNNSYPPFSSNNSRFFNSYTNGQNLNNGYSSSSLSSVSASIPVIGAGVGGIGSSFTNTPQQVFYLAPNVQRTADQLTEEEQIKLLKRMTLIQQLPSGSYDENKKNKECVICMIDFEVNDTIKYLPCMHTFHQSCIDTWLIRSLICPSCMEPVDSGMLSAYENE